MAGLDGLYEEFAEGGFEFGGDYDEEEVAGLEDGVGGGAPGKSEEVDGRTGVIVPESTSDKSASSSSHDSTGLAFSCGRDDLELPVS